MLCATLTLARLDDDPRVREDWPALAQAPSVAARLPATG